MEIQKCVRCKKRPAVVFITRMENGQTVNEGLCLLVQAELLVELGHASAGIHQLLLAREEGVTLRADFHLDILLGRTCLNHITAGASNRSLLIIGMDSFLHCSRSPLSLQDYPRKAFTSQRRCLVYHSFLWNASIFTCYLKNFY